MTLMWMTSISVPNYRCQLLCALTPALSTQRDNQPPCLDHTPLTRPTGELANVDIKAAGASLDELIRRLPVPLRAIRNGVDPDAPELESTWHPFEFTNDTPLQVNVDALHVDVLGRSTDLERPTLKAGDFITKVCEFAGFDFRHLSSRARDRNTARARRLVVTLGVERWRQKGTALARVLNKNSDVVIWWVGEGIRRRLEDEEFAAKLDKLDEELSASLTQSRQSDKSGNFPTS
jgi:hypothetical protein